MRQVPTNREDGDDFVRLLARFEPQIRSCVLLWVADWNDAQDVMQQVSLVLWQRFDQFQPGTNFLAWAVTVAKLHAKDYWRRKGRERRLFSDAFIDVVAADAVAMTDELDERRGMLKHCVDRLKPAHRELLFLRYSHDASVDDIAGRLHRSADAIYKALARTRAALLDCVTRRIALADRR